jgi:formate dehydrogenase maturation protein FdhE
MSFTVTCSCGKKLAAREEHVGKRAKCPQCGQMFLIAPPGPGRPAAQPEQPSSTPLYDGQRIEHWLDLLTSDDPADRKKAANNLAAVGPEAASELTLLIQRTTSQNVLVRHWSTACIGRMGSVAKAAMSALVDRLSDEQPLVREKAARAIEQVMPDAKPFVPALLRGLEAADEARRAEAIDLFHRNLKTSGISRFRFWSCTCGRVYIKLDLEQRLRKLVEAPDEVSFEGKRSCRQCGAVYDDRDIYEGKHDVPEPYWPKLQSKFGQQLSLADNFLASAPADPGYRISDEERSHEVVVNMASLAPFALSLESPALEEGDQGYVIAAAPAAPVYGVLGQQGDVELVPGVEVPRSGKYKCTSCAKKRLSMVGGGPSPARASVVMQFKEGKRFTECPNCRDLTEWEWLG